MAGSQRQLNTDQWRPENFLDRQPSSKNSILESKPSSRRAGTSPLHAPSTEKPASKSSAHSPLRRQFSSRSPSPPSYRDRTKERGRSRRSPRSPAPVARDPPAHRHGHKRDSANREPSLSKHRQRKPSPKSGHPRRTSKSPSRASRSDRKHHRASARDRSHSPARLTNTSTREATRPYSPKPEPFRDTRSPRYHSPDRYIPSKRRRSPAQSPSGFRPGGPGPRHRSRSPVSQPSKRPKQLPSSDLLSQNHRIANRSRSPLQRSSYSNTEPIRRGRSFRQDSNPRPKQSRPQNSTSPAPSPNRRVRNSSPSYHRDLRRRRPRSRSTSRQPRGRSRVQEGKDLDMRPSYHYQSSGRGGSRSGRPPPDYPYSRTPSYGPPLSPYGAGRGGWAGTPPYQSQHGTPPYGYGPYRQHSYPSYPPSPYYGAPPPPPPPNPYYAGSPPPPPPHNYAHYPPPPDRRASTGQPVHSEQRSASQSSAKSTRRPQFSNLSWTPATGSRGGKQTHPSDRKLGKESGKSDRAEHDEDDYSRRPSDDLRSLEEDEKRKGHELKSSASVSERTKEESNGDGKIKFAMKAKPTPAAMARGLDQLNSRGRDSRHARASYRDERPGRYESRQKEPRRERRLVKKIIEPPTIPKEYIDSESVYFRKQGNESVVGSGTYGKVYRGIHVYTGSKVALKKIRMEGERDGFPVTAIREVKLLQSLNHANVVKLQEVMVEKNDCFMVFEYLSHDLTGLLNHPTFQLSDAHKKHLAFQIFEGLDYLHKRGVLHRDIKAANILISNTGQLKLADFGLARFYAKRRDLDYTNRVITIWYRSPELLLGETKYGPAVDIWSAACVLVEIFTKHAIFPGDGGEINQLEKIYAVLGTPTRAEWPEIVNMTWFELLRPAERKSSTFAEKYQNRMPPQAFDLLTKMFSYDPQNRPNAAEVLDHPFFVTEEPLPARAIELKDLDGDWHEFESKALRKEREKQERDARKAAEKRKDVDDAEFGKETKRLRVDEDHNGAVSTGAAATTSTATL